MVDTEAWLGHVAAEMTDAQRDRFDQLVFEYESRVGSPAEENEYSPEGNAAWVAALEIALGEFDLDKRGAAYEQARCDVQAGAIMAAIDGMPETVASEKARMSRLTLRKLLGKGK